MQPYNVGWNWAEIDSFVGYALGLEFYMPANKQTIMYPDWENAIYNTV